MKIKRSVWIPVYVGLSALLIATFPLECPAWVSVGAAVALFLFSSFTDPSPRKPRTPRGDFEKCDCPQCEDVDDDTTWVKDC